MTTYIGLLRGINVGGHKLVPMADLRDLLTKLRFTDPRSLLQSGNIVFKTEGKTNEQVEQLLEVQVAKRFGFSVDCFVRTAAELKTVIAQNPFTEEAKRDPSHLLAMFLKTAPSSKDVDALRAAIVGSEVLRAKGRTAYFVYPDGIGRSKLTPALIEKKLGTRGTARNWNTVLKLHTLTTQI